MKQFQVKKENFTEGRIIEFPSPDLEDGQVLLTIEKFAYTSNNITYAVAGYTLKYWDFFPPAQNENQEWGIIPVWGSAIVKKSNAKKISVGDRFFGYFPCADQVILQPAKVTKHQIIEGAPHRASLPKPYNVYSWLSTQGQQEMEKYRMLLGPLFLTAWCLKGTLASQNWYNAQQIIILSASSKTSLGLAYALKQHPHAPPVIGLTSRRNIDTIKDLDLYQQLFAYQDLMKIDLKNAVLVDMSGNAKVIRNLNKHLNDKLNYCLRVGLTHWDENTSNQLISKDKSKFFFAPSYLEKYIASHGIEAYDKEKEQFLKQAFRDASSWLKFETINGIQGLQRIHEAVCNGKIEPYKGLIIEN